MTQKEMVATVVSAINGCGYCVEHHGAALEEEAEQPGLTEWVLAGDDRAELDERTRQLVEFAEKLTREPDDMGAADVDELRSVGMSDEEILDLVQLIAYFNYTNRVATALGVDPEEES